jgi:hypothetical protein
MKKIISTIVALGFISSMLITTAYAGDRHGADFLNPLWIPAAILSTLAVITSPPVQPVVYERRGYYEPRQTVIYEEPRHYRHDYYDGRYRAYEEPRYRDYR